MAIGILRFVAFCLSEGVFALRSDNTMAFWHPGDVSPQQEADAARATDRNLKLCRKKELSDSDLRIRATPASGDPLQQRLGGAERRGSALWETLFHAWSGKKVLLAGDSLMDQLFQVAVCAASLLGGAVELSNLVRFDWVPNATVPEGKEVNISDVRWGSVMSEGSSNQNTQAIVFRASIHMGNHSTTLDYFRHYALTSRCQICTTRQEEASCGACSIETALVTPIDTLLSWAKKYDHAYVNLGHDVMMRSNSQQVDLKAHALCSALKVKSIDNKVVLVEHPPQHFPSPDGTGNYQGGHAHRSCECSLPRISEQDVSKNNERIGRIASNFGIRFARIWQFFSATGCQQHRPPDCSHYHISPILWAPVAAALAEA